jgi:tRNA A-37 threonylcarbamoyl transferase component Bud32
MNTNANISRCPKCHAPVPPDAPQGICPRCALAGAAAFAETASTSSPRIELPAIEAVRAAFPQLEILELIGAGGMGVVYQARQPKLDRLVALKLLPEAQARDAAFAERFNREARLLARLNHPNIVTVYDFGESGGFFHLLMEYVDGVNLRQAMQAGGFTPTEALGIVPKICEALQYAHSEGILHRDIKPENILLDAKGRVKIADFGIAKLMGESRKERTLTASGSAVGTPQYMAPEQIEHPRDVDHRADIYSLGVVFYEMLTGELPIGRFAPPSQKAAVDQRVDDVVMRTLEKERERRFQSADEVKTSVEGLKTPTLPMVARTQVVTPGAQPETPVAEELTSRRAIWGAVLSASAMFFGVVLFFGMFTLGVETREGPGQAMPELRPAVVAILIPLALLALTLFPAIAGTLFGATALGDIRRSGGRIRGLPLALFGALWWPLLILDASFLAIAFFLAPRSFSSDGEAHRVLLAVLAVTVIASLTIDFFIIRAVWGWAHRGVSPPAVAATGTVPGSHSASTLAG